MSTNQGSFPTQKPQASGSANITGGTINGAVIGDQNPAAGTFTDLTATKVISSEIGPSILTLLTVPAGPGTLSTQTYADNAAAGAKTGGTTTLATLYAGGTVWTAGDYIGIASGSQGSQTALNCIPWVTRVAGILSDVGVQALSGAAANSTVTIYRSAGGNSLSYSSTALTFSVGIGDLAGSDTNAAHAVSLNAGDCVIALLTSSGNWSTNGLSLTGRFTPATPV